MDTHATPTPATDGTPDQRSAGQRCHDGLLTALKLLLGSGKLPTTAGVTNLDYVAVNQTAIAAVLLGLLSAVSFFGHLLLITTLVLMLAIGHADVLTGTLDAPHGPLQGINRSRMTAVMSVHGDRWLITSFQNTLIAA